ncbi:MAG: hypothetical protein KGJ87_10490 [Planctomycetota bacterium]|nr:hypothetical protein [Planctomycetota bacterium]MDE1890044.1 hypothetical protein [Planctomycetota bacterium]MDE2217569.1 hypothetical protein [Planctomycetota bacterium]
MITNTKQRKWLIEHIGIIVAAFAVSKACYMGQKPVGRILWDQSNYCYVYAKNDKNG